MSIISDYIASRDIAHQEHLNTLYNALKEVIPNATERIAYQMPTLYGDRFVAHFNDFKDHVSLFPGPAVLDQYKDEIKDYKTSKGTIQFGYNEPIPVSLIKRIISYKIEHGLK